MYGLCVAWSVLVYFPDTRTTAPGRALYVPRPRHSTTHRTTTARTTASQTKGVDPVAHKDNAAHIADMDFRVDPNHGHVPVMRDRMADLLAPAGGGGR